MSWFIACAARPWGSLSTDLSDYGQLALSGNEFRMQTVKLRKFRRFGKINFLYLPVLIFMEKNTLYLTFQTTVFCYAPIREAKAATSSSANWRTYSTGLDTLHPPAVYGLAFYQSNEWKNEKINEPTNDLRKYELKFVFSRTWAIFHMLMNWTGERRLANSEPKCNFWRILLLLLFHFSI